MDWEGANYIGLTLDWNHKAGFVDISIPTYVDRILKRLCHPTPSKSQYSLHERFPLIYCGKGTRQYATAPDSSIPSISYIHPKSC